MFSIIPLVHAACGPGDITQTGLAGFLLIQVLSVSHLLGWTQLLCVGAHGPQRSELKSYVGLSVSQLVRALILFIRHAACVELQLPSYIPQRFQASRQASLGFCCPRAEHTSKLPAGRVLGIKGAITNQSRYLTISVIAHLMHRHACRIVINAENHQSCHTSRKCCGCRRVFRGDSVKPHIAKRCIT